MVKGPSPEPTLTARLRREQSVASRPTSGLELNRATCREGVHPAIRRETDHLHLTSGSRAIPLCDAPRAGVLRLNGRNHIRQPQNVARVVENATHRFGRENLAPDGGVERVLSSRSNVSLVRYPRSRVRARILRRG